MADLLIVDDDVNLASLLSEFLDGHGHSVRVAHDGREAMRTLFSRRPDLVILDVTMPGQDGWTTLSRIRELSDLPVIMLTARSEESDVLRGFSLGSDDYVTKPFSFAELAARIQAVMIRSLDDPSASESLLVQGDLEVDLSGRRVRRAGALISLTPTEFKLLVALMKRPGVVVSADELVREVWGPEYSAEVGYVRRYIWHLRNKLEPDPENPRYLHNERGHGYRFQSVS